MDCIADVHTALGEGPCWIKQEQCLLWTDIKAQSIYRWSATGGFQCQTMSEKICSIVPRASGGYLGAGYNGLLEFDAEFRAGAIANPEPDLPGNRFNDGKVDRQGRFWAGTMDHAEKAASGSLYRFDADLTWIKVDTGYRVTNGPAFSVDGRTMYHTDSALQQVYAFDIDNHGNATDRRVFLKFQQKDGYPDGMTVDAEDCVWIAFWDGWCVRRFSPEGMLLVEVPVPVQRPTSIAFGCRQRSS